MVYPFEVDGGPFYSGRITFFFRQVDHEGRFVAVVGGAVLLYNSFFFWGHKKRNWHGKLFAHVQIVSDWIALGVLSYILGGAGSPLIPFFIFHVVIASILLDRLESYIQTTVAILLVLALRFVSSSDIPLPWSEWSSAVLGYPLPVSFVLMVFTFYAATYLAGTVGAMLKRSEEHLALAYRRLEKKDEEKTRFLLMTAHSLKAPLSTVQGLIQSHIYSSKGDIPKNTLEILERIQIRTANLAQMVRDLLVLASARRIVIKENRSVNLGVIFKQAAEKLKLKISEKALSVSLDVHSGLVTVHGDPTEWERVFENILENAVKYSQSGGKIHARISKEGGMAHCSIKDSGIGIPKEDVPRVFDEFFRAGNARSFTEEGTGLGLSIVRHIVRSSGGKIHIESAPGEGTTVTISLPLKPDDGE